MNKYEEQTVVHVETYEHFKTFVPRVNLHAVAEQLEKQVYDAVYDAQVKSGMAQEVSIWIELEDEIEMSAAKYIVVGSCTTEIHKNILYVNYNSHTGDCRYP